MACRLLYYITDRKAFAGDESLQRRLLLEKIAEAARCGIDYIQLRERDLPGRELESLAREAVRAIREAEHPRNVRQELQTRLLVNSRTDVALVTRADGVHLRSDDISPADVRRIWQVSASAPSTSSEQSAVHEKLDELPIIGVSCHTLEEVRQAAEQRAEFAVFAPVFEKKDSPARPAGLAALKEACCAAIPVFALGGVTLQNAQSCFDAGAAGVAGIRLFQENEIASIVRMIRG